MESVLRSKSEIDGEDIAREFPGSVDPSHGTKCCVILNQDSGTMSEILDEAFVEEVESVLRGNGWDPEINVVSGKDIEKTVQSALEKGVGAVIAGGGDGTTTSIARLMLGSDTPLGILPFGTLNLAARDLGSPLEPIESVQALYPTRKRSIDVLEVGDRLCLCVTVFGVYPELLEKGLEYHGRSWWMKFVKGGWVFTRAFLRSRLLRVKLELRGDGSREVKTRMLFVVPGSHRDEVGIIPKRDSLSSGSCSVIVSKHRSAWSMARLLFNYVLGRTQTDPEMEVIESSQLRIRCRGRSKLVVTIDGELAKFSQPLTFDLKKKALLVLDPSQ